MPVGESEKMFILPKSKKVMMKLKWNKRSNSILLNGVSQN